MSHEQRVEEAQRHSRAISDHRHNGWTTEEEAKLIELFNTPIGLEAIGKLIGRSRGGVRSKAKTLGLERDYEHTPSGNSLHWTPAQIETLRAQWTDGVPAPHIAHSIGRTVKAVYTKVIDLGLPGRQGWSSHGTPQHFHVQGKVAPLEIILRPCAESVLITLEELTNNSCRWPIGEVGVDGFRFCGAATADLAGLRPYCQTHMRIAYHPTLTQNPSVRA
jgi:GcrA cell cycle regulator